MDSDALKAEIMSVLELDTETGLFTWRVGGFGKARAGALAGNLGVGGYVYIGLRGRRYRAHRLVYLIVHGQMPKEIDHVNGIRDDNRPVNLRPCSHKENLRNQSTRATNKSGRTGVYWDRALGKWRAQICVDGKTKYIGSFSCLNEAAQARAKVAASHGFHERHG